MKPQFPLWKDMLKIGLPAGAEFAMMAVYLMLVYALARPFGAAAQAGFGIGMRVVQALFMPVVALGFSVAPVAGQNVGARLGDRVKAVFKDASLMAAGWMLLMAVFCNIAPAALIGIFSDDPAVIAVGEEYLRIVALDLRRVGGDLRVLQHVPGDGQHHAVAHRLGDAHRRDCRARDRASRRCPASSWCGSGTCRPAPSCFSSPSC